MKLDRSPREERAHDGEPRAEAMIRRLVEGRETGPRIARNACQPADAPHDQPTCNLLTQQMQVQEKAAWTLRSLLE